MKHLLTILIATVTLPASAEFMDGNKLLADFQDQGVVPQMHSLGYVKGVADAHLGLVHCAPSNATGGQMRDMVRDYLIQNPGQRHHTGDLVIARVLGTKWPCPSRRQGSPA